MTVRTKKSTINPETLRAAQLAWLEDEFEARRMYATTRLANLARYRDSLIEDDLFDAAYAIWDDYIDGRRADEVGELVTPRLSEQAGIFALCSSYLPSAELLALATRAWGKETFEVLLRHSTGVRFGKLGWYRGDQLTIRVSAGTGDDIQLTVWADEGRAKRELVAIPSHVPLTLHPIFGRG